MRPYDIMKGTKIHLRALEPQDVDLLYEWENDSDVWGYGNTTIPFSRHQLQEYILSVQDIYADKQVRFMICKNNNTKTEMGCIDMFNFDPKNMRAGVGILIGNKKNRNKGYASEALSLLINYAFHTLCIHQIYCTIPEGNEISIKLFLKQGFKKIATHKQWIRDNEGWKDELLFQLINPME